VGAARWLVIDDLANAIMIAVGQVDRYPFDEV